MLRKALLSTVLLVATLAIPAIFPRDTDAQVFVRGRRFGVAVGTPYYRGYYGGGYYGGGYYSGYRPYYNSYYSYPGYYGPSYYRYWR